MIRPTNMHKLLNVLLMLLLLQRDDAMAADGAQQAVVLHRFPRASNTFAFIQISPDATMFCSVEWHVADKLAPDTTTVQFYKIGNDQRGRPMSSRVASHQMRGTVDQVILLRDNRCLVLGHEFEDRTRRRYCRLLLIDAKNGGSCRVVKEYSPLPRRQAKENCSLFMRLSGDESILAINSVCPFGSTHPPLAYFYNVSSGTLVGKFSLGGGESVLPTPIAKRGFIFPLKTSSDINTLHLLRFDGEKTVSIFDKIPNWQDFTFSSDLQSSDSNTFPLTAWISKGETAMPVKVDLDVEHMRFKSTDTQNPIPLRPKILKELYVFGAFNDGKQVLLIGTGMSAKDTDRPIEEQRRLYFVSIWDETCWKTIIIGFPCDSAIRYLGAKREDNPDRLRTFWHQFGCSKSPKHPDHRILFADIPLP